MSDSRREQIVQAVKTLMGSITVVNGYAIDLGKNVFRGTTRILEKDELPGLIINEGKETTDSTLTIGLDHNYLILDLAARATYTDGDDWYKVCNNMLADIIKAFGTDYSLGGLALDINIDSNQTGIDEGQKLTAGTDISVTVEYRTAHLNPFS